MQSTFAWLDYSEHDRRRAMVVIDLFQEHDTRDELGIGTVRDALADLMFPGTSTIQTRPRYFLLVPWVYQAVEKWAERRRPPLAEIKREARRQELALLKVLVECEDTDGVIGIEAREKLQRLPSSIYWLGMSTWGIRRFPGSQSQFHRVLQNGRAAPMEQQEEGDDQPLDARGFWHAALPDRPNGFPNEQSLDLTRDEAEYLQDRIRAMVGYTLLAWMVEKAETLEGVTAPWQHPRAVELPAELSRQLAHAQNFSELMHGTALLYNLMLARKAKLPDLIDQYDEIFGDWAKGTTTRRRALLEWNRNDFWQTVLTVNPRTPPKSQAFVNSWIDLALDNVEPAAMAGDTRALALIEDRELQLKGIRRARLQDPRALELWTGAAGTGLINYRWPTVRYVMQDIRAALARKDADA